mgnify:CR=1 FL=1
MCESTARRIFGTSDATGREFMLNYAPFRVCGIVKDVSSLAESSYAQIWIPASASSSMQDTWCGDLMGNFSATILARSTDDFDDIYGHGQPCVEIGFVVGLAGDKREVEDFPEIIVGVAQFGRGYRLARQAC